MKKRIPEKKKGSNLKKETIKAEKKSAGKKKE